LDGGGPDSQIRTVFSWSYTALNPPAARLFRLLGLHPGPDISVAAAASLAARSAAEVRRPLADLTRANLLTEHVPGRYTFHDLLRAYASDLAHTEDPDEHRRAAVTRMLDHYTHTAYTADRLLDPARDPIHLPLAPPAPGSRPEPLTDQHTALTWLTTEYPVLTAVLRQAADAGLDEAAWQLAWALDTFLFRRGHWQDQAATWGIALTVAGRQADPVPRAEAHRGLARVDVRLGRHADADAHLQRAVALYAEAGHRVGQARAHHNLAILWGRWGHPDKAVAYGNQARALFRAAGDSRGEASALNGIGWHEASLGDYPQALAHCERALAILEQVGDRDGQASTWDSLGYIRHHLGHTTLAVECYQRSLDLFRDLGDRHTEAEALTRLGDAHWDSGQPDAARAAWSQALRILTELDHPGADAVHARISAGPPAPRRGAAPRRHP
jgi:tetratricopeptide (TPR) repeat protein